MLVRTGGFIKGMKDESNKALERQQTGISDLRHSYIEKSMSMNAAKEQRRLCLIKYNSPFMLFWEFIVAATFIFTFFLAPLNMATVFRPYQTDFRTVEFAIDVVIIIDICVNFVSETVRDVETVIYLKDAALLYLKSYFLIDIASILPNLIMLESSTATYPLKLLRFIRIQRFFKFFQSLENLVSNIFQDNNSWKERGRRLIMFLNLMTLVYLCLHAYACVWLYLGLTDEIYLFKEQIHEVNEMNKMLSYGNNSYVPKEQLQGWLYSYSQRGINMTDYKS